MHLRAVCRVIRGTCRKFREPPSNDGINLAGEEVRQGGQQGGRPGKDDFSPKHSIPEALGWTTGIILTYEFTHRRSRRFQCQFEESNSNYSQLSNLQLYFRRCPFAIAKHVNNQPTTLATNSVRSIQDKSHVLPIPTVRVPRTPPSSPSSPNPRGIRKSIDLTPFLAEPISIGFFKSPTPTPSSSKLNFDETETDDDEGVHFDETISKFDEVRVTNKPAGDPVAVSLAEKLSGDLFSALGTFKFLTSGIGKGKTEKQKLDAQLISKKSPAPGIPASIPPINAFELLEKGIELGSSRALYNIGVAYDRLNDSHLAEYYYKRAADSGHPLAAFNVGVYALKDGKIKEGKQFMEYAAQNGVPEAKEVLKEFQ